MDETLLGDGSVAISTAELNDSSNTAQPFIGRWNRLVSTTNWEKGRIIHQWREASIAEDAPAVDYSDEAWTRLVGGVTGQHVGRLRRVFQRFGEVHEQYDGLYWSHFFAALDWDDAEMWLEGAVQSGWSVSQMRRTRWETLGGDKKRTPQDDDIVRGELDEDFEPAVNTDPESDTIVGSYEQVQGGPAEKSERNKTADRAEPKSSLESDDEGAAIFSDDSKRESIEFVRPFENLGELPDDLADAFESFKLAILRHKADDWAEISREEVLSCLDALKELARAPSAEESPF